MTETSNVAPVTVGIDNEGNALIRITAENGVSITVTLNSLGVENLISLLAGAINRTHVVTVVPRTPPAL